MLRDRFREQATLIEAYIARRRADETRHRVPLHVFRHIEAQELDTHDRGKLPRHFCFTDARGSGEQEAADRLALIAEAGARHFDGRRQGFDRLVLPEDHELQIPLEVLQHFPVGGGHTLGGDARHACDYVLDMTDLDNGLAFGNGLQALACTGLVDDVDRLVRHVTLVDVTGGQLRGGFQGIDRVSDPMVLLEAGLEPHEDLHGLRHRRLHHIDFLEATCQGMVLLEDPAIFLVCRRADAPDLTIREHRLDEVRGVHDAAGGRARADDGVNLVDEQDRTRLLLELRDDALQTLLKITAILRTGDQRAHVECVDSAVGKNLRHLPLDNETSQTFRDRSLTHAGFADIKRVVLASPAQDLDRALDFELAPDERIDATVLRHAVEVRRVLLEGTAAFGIALRIRLRVLLVGLLLGDLRQTVRDVVDDIETSYMLAIEQEHGVALLLAENRDQHVSNTNFLLAARLHVEHRTLQYSLEAQRRLYLALLPFLESRSGLIDMVLELLLQLAQIRATSAQNFPHLGCIEDREQQVLDGQIFVTSLARLVKGVVEAVFKLVRKHVRQTSRRSGFFQCAHERMLVIASVGRHLRHFSLCYLIGIYTADSLTLGMDLQHDARCGRSVQTKELFKNVDDKLHRSVVVIEEHHLVQGGLFDLRSGFFDDDAAVGTGGMLIGHGVLYMGRQTATQACDDGPSLLL